MFRNVFSKMTLAVLAGVATLAVANPAKADFRYSLTTTTGFSTTPGGIAFGGSPGNFNGTFGGFLFADTSASFNVTAAQGNLNSTALTVTNQNATTQSFTLMVSVNALTSPLSPLSYASTVSGTWGSGNVGSVANMTSYFGNTGVLFGATNAINFGPFNGTSGVGAFAQAINGPDQTYDPEYSMTHMITIQLVAGATVQFTFRTEVTPVPEPATMTAGLIGLGCMCVARFRRRSK